jgi:hypothetical protein
MFSKKTGRKSDFYKKVTVKPGIVAHICNPSYWGGRGQED